MIKRIVATLATGLLLSGSTFAETPADQPSNPAPPAPMSGAMTAPDSAWNGNPPNTTPSPLTTGIWSPTASNSSDRFWIDADYLLGWMRGTNVPPLVTTSPSGTAQNVAGVFPSGSTKVLFGNGQMNGDERSGLELGAGGWFNAEHTLGFEAGFSMLESQASIFSASSNGSTILARPYVDATTGNPASVLIAFPGTGTGAGSGSIDARVESGNYYEAHLDLTTNIWDAGWWHVDGLLGYRFYKYNEGLGIETVQKPTNANFVAGTQLNTEDSFNTYNTFNGADFGLRTTFDMGNLSVGFLTRIAAGGVFREANIQGSTTTSVPGQAPLTQSGGIYALNSNIGNHNSYDFSIMPEFGTDITWEFMPNWKARIGYSVLMLQRVARATDEVDENVNPNLFPPALAGASPSNPVWTNPRNDVWIQTLKIGLEWTF